MDQFEKKNSCGNQLKVEPSVLSFSRQRSALVGFTSSSYTQNSFLTHLNSSLITTQSADLPSNYINGMNAIKRKNSLKIFKLYDSKH
jgi:hypothetical protein